MNLASAITERRARIATLQLELEQLEAAATILGGLTPAVVKPPPAVRKERPVRTEKPAKAPPVDASTYPKCGHPRTPENSYAATYVKADGTRSQVCKTCTLAGQKRRAAPAATESSPAVVVKIAPTHVEAATKWAKQCQMLDSTSGRRCSLPGGHPMPHSASGRTFSAAAAINIAAMGGTVAGGAA